MLGGACLFTQNFDPALQNDVVAGFVLRLVRLGVNRLAVLVGLKLGFRLRHNFTRSHAGVLNGFAAGRVVFRH